MSLKKTKKRKKFSRMRGSKTHEGGARKKRKGSGHRGGKGMSGTGKRADHKKTLITKKYGHNYFGKRGITSRKTQKDKGKKINIGNISLNIKSYLDKGRAKKTGKGIEISFKDYKILGKGDVNEKLIIKAEKASKSALKKVNSAGGEIILSDKTEKKKSRKKPEIKKADKKQNQIKEEK